MKYQILQCANGLKFFDYNMCFNFEKAKKIFDLNDFKVIYEGELKTQFDNIDSYLNELYYMFNMKKPNDFKGHSLSVGDIIKLDNMYYYVCSCGFDIIDFE